MKLLFINQYYWPDAAATAQMLSDLCEHLAAAGHDVHVLASRGKYDDGATAGQKLPRYQQHRRVHIHRINATGFGKRSTLGRITDYLTFHALIGLQTVLTAHRYDAIITLTTPPLVGLYATIVKKILRTKHICWVMDLHPDCEFELGLFDRRKWWARLLDWLNSTHFRHADHNVVLGDYMAKRLLDKNVDPKKITAIPVWGHQLTPLTNDQNPLRTELKLNGKFVVMYSGNAGLIHTFDEICQAAKQLCDDDRFVFLFVGGGRRMSEIRQFAQQHNLTNMRFMNYFPRERLTESLTLADVHLLSLRHGMAGIAAPSKLYGIMAAARPAIFIGPHDCEPADHIRAANCGRIIKLNDTNALRQTLLQLADDPHLRTTLATNARNAFEQTFNAPHCCQHWQTIIEQTVTTKKPPA